MPIFFGLFALSLIIGLVTLIPHLGWTEIIEGQVGKQNFVAHMTEAFQKGDLLHGFPIRYFAEPWHPGPVAWAEEVPFYHVLSAGLARLFNVNSVTSGRILSFAFGIFFLYAIYDLAKSLFSENKIAPYLAVLVLFWMPGFQIYSTSVIPDLAMAALVTFAYGRSLRKQVGLSYGVLLLACLMKYFAVFAVLALFIYDCTRFPKWKERIRSFLYAGIAVLPTLAYLAYFIIAKIPNPVTEYRTANGYGHLAGNFLFRAQFYLRFVTWVFIKDPNLIFALLGVGGFVLAVKNKVALSEKWRLPVIHFCTAVLFALIFASSFFVHDYYALTFMLPIALFATYALSQIRIKPLVGAVITGSMVLTFLMVRDATFRLTNYVDAAKVVRDALSFVPDRSETDLVGFVSDFSLPPIPILSKKSGWAFSANRLEDQRAFLTGKLSDPKLKAFVFYCREPDADHYFVEWRNADSRLAQMKILKDQTFESEGRKGAKTRLVVLAP